MNTSLKTRKAFTIVEVAVVIVTIGILATITFATYSGMQMKSVNAVTKSDTAAVGGGIKLERNLMERTFPTALGPLNDMEDIDPNAGTKFIYTSNGKKFALTGYSERMGSKAYCLTSESPVVVDGACVGHSIP